MHHARSAVEGSRRSVLENGLTGQVKYCEDFCGFPNFLGLRSNVESPDRYARRIAKMTSPRRLSLETKRTNCIHGLYFVLSKRRPRPASSAAVISARASIQSPSRRPLLSQGAILTCEFLRIRFALPESAAL